MKSLLKTLILALSPSIALASAGAATQDPHEGFNRAMFAFNRAVLENLVEPTAAYLGEHLPPAVIDAGHRVYGNLTEIEFLLNGLLVGDPAAAGVAAGRFAINSTLGIAGIFDVARHVGLERFETDFIASLCQTGLPPGPYVVLPLVGPANAYSAGALAGGIAVEVYLLSFISTTLAMADFIVIDVSGSASSLRYMRDLPPETEADPYQVQRDQHLAYVRDNCGIGGAPVRQTADPGAADPIARPAAP